MEPVTLIVPVAPVAKARPRFTVDAKGRTRAVTTEGTREAEDTIGHYWRAQYGARKPWPRDVALQVVVTVYLAKPKGSARAAPTVRPDWDNFGKLASDALTGLAWTDDAQVTDGRVIKRYDARPRWEIRIREVEP